MSVSSIFFIKRESAAYGHAGLKMNRLDEIQKILDSKAPPIELRDRINHSKIAFIDDEIDLIKALVSGLREEGFTNVIEFKCAPSVHEVIERKFEAIILDLTGVAEASFNDDGIGFLRAIKQEIPTVPVLVVSGTRLSVDIADAASLADLRRQKPVKVGDLASDLRFLLRQQYDADWAALRVLREFRHRSVEIESSLSFFQKYRLKRELSSLESMLMLNSGSVEDQLLKVSEKLKPAGEIVTTIIKIIAAVGG